MHTGHYSRRLLRYSDVAMDIAKFKVCSRETCFTVTVATGVWKKGRDSDAPSPIIVHHLKNNPHTTY